MVYVLSTVQIVLVVGLILTARGIKQYANDRDTQVDSLIAQFMAEQRLSTEAYAKGIQELTASNAKQIERLIEQNQKEREMMIERIQFPDMVQGIAPSMGPIVDRGDGHTGKTVGEREEWEADNPGEIHERLEPMSDDDGVVRPIKAVTPFGARDAQS